MLGKTLWAAAMLAGLGTSGAVAEPLDGKRPVICASFVAVSCDATGDCASGTAEGVNLPEMFRVDLQSATVRTSRADGTIVNTKVERVQTDGAQIVLHGAEAGRAWSATVEKASGRMVIAVAGDREAFAVFGTCMGID